VILIIFFLPFSWAGDDHYHLTFIPKMPAKFLQQYNECLPDRKGEVMPLSQKWRVLGSV
jgi:hypothetical protein